MYTHTATTATHTHTQPHTHAPHDRQTPTPVSHYARRHPLCGSCCPQAPGRTGTSTRRCIATSMSCDYHAEHGRTATAKHARSRVADGKQAHILRPHRDDLTHNTVLLYWRRITQHSIDGCHGLGFVSTERHTRGHWRHKRANTHSAAVWPPCQV